MDLWMYIRSKMQDNLHQEIWENGAVLSYEQMIVFAQEFAKKLNGIKSCAILCHSQMAQSMALLACFAAGVTAIPLSERYGQWHCKKIEELVGPEAVITDKNGELQVLRIPEATYREPEVFPALIMCTSGTTGVPKGAMLTPSNVMTNVRDIASYFAINSADTILIARPLYHCAVLTGEFLTALVKGVKIRFYSETFQPAAILDLLREHKITAFCSTPTLLSLLVHFQRSKHKNHLKHIGVSGEIMSWETGMNLAEAFPQADIYHLYGLTEAGPRVSYLPPSLFKEYADCVGIPLPSVSLKILTAGGRPAKTNETGMLWVKGENVMAGYYNDPEKTAEVLNDGWLCTGDLALFNEKGLLQIKGRLDGLIIKGGMNIYPGEIEAALKADARVREVLVKGYRDNRLTTRIELNIAGDFSNLSEIKELCRQRLSDYQMPSTINRMDELPKNGSGKIIRR